jgi:hypothetical protein
MARDYVSKKDYALALISLELVHKSITARSSFPHLLEKDFNLYGVEFELVAKELTDKLTEEEYHGFLEIVKKSMASMRGSIH